VQASQADSLPFHNLRATYATLVADQGSPVSALSVLLGHANASTTASYMRPESQGATLAPSCHDPAVPEQMAN
jgi:integrase